MPASISAQRSGSRVSSWPVARARSQVCMKTSPVKNRETAVGSGTSPMCRLLSTRSAEAGSSSSACTSPWRCRHAPTGSSSTDGPAGRCTSAPAARNDGNHSTRCRTTSRAVQPSTGPGRPTGRGARRRRRRRSGRRSRGTPGLARTRSCASDSVSPADSSLRVVSSGVAVVMNRHTSPWASTTSRMSRIASAWTEVDHLGELREHPDHRDDDVQHHRDHPVQPAVA